MAICLCDQFYYIVCNGVNGDAVASTESLVRIALRDSHSVYRICHVHIIPGVALASP